MSAKLIELRGGDKAAFCLGVVAQMANILARIETRLSEGGKARGDSWNFDFLDCAGGQWSSLKAEGCGGGCACDEGGVID